MGNEVVVLQDVVGLCAASAAEIYKKRADKVASRKGIVLAILTLGFVTKLRRLEWIARRASRMASLLK